MEWALPSVAQSDDVGRTGPKRSLRMTLSIIPVHGIPEVRPKDDLVGLVLAAVASATVVLLPLDPDASAVRLRDELAKRAHATVAVVITDTFGRAWREGHTNVAIGIAGLPALKRYVGQRDPEGYELRVTEIAVADEIAAAAELVMGKLDRCPVAIVRGLTFEDSDETAHEYVRPAERDMFR